MKAAGVSLVLILLLGSLIVPIGFSKALGSDLTVPNPPTNLSATAVSSSQINLSWTAPINAINDQVNGYKIERRNSCSSSFSPIVENTTNTNTSYSNTGLLSGTCYEYRVFARNAVGTSIASNNATATTFNVPNAPTGLNATTLSSSSIKLVWNAPSNNGGAPIIGYKIQRNGTTITNNTGTVRTNFTDTGLLASHQQSYRVAAWNGVGLGPYTNNATAKTSIKTTASLTENLGQLVSNFVHKRNELLKQEKAKTILAIMECNERLKVASLQDKVQIKEGCKVTLKAIKEEYKEARRLLQEAFKDFRETAKSQLLEAKKAKALGKQDVKDLQKDIKSFENQAKIEQKQLKKEAKQAEKKFKKSLKELKKVSKKAKKDRYD